MSDVAEWLHSAIASSDDPLAQLFAARDFVGGHGPHHPPTPGTGPAESPPLEGVSFVGLDDEVGNMSTSSISSRASSRQARRTASRGRNSTPQLAALANGAGPSMTSVPAESDWCSTARGALQPDEQQAAAALLQSVFPQVPRLEAVAHAAMAARTAQPTSGGSRTGDAGNATLRSPVEVYTAACAAAAVAPQRTVLRILQSGATAERLNFSGVVLGPRGAPPLIRALAACPHLRHLSLRACNIDDRCAKELAHVCAGLPALQTLDLSGNHHLCFAAGTHIHRLAATSAALVDVRLDGGEVRRGTLRAIEVLTAERLLTSLSMT